MNNSVKCQDLFTFNSDLFENLFSGTFYPWELLPSLSCIISDMIKNGIEGYKLIGDDILVGEGTVIAPTAHIEGPTIIGKNCNVRHGAFLRGAVLIGDSCVIGNSTEVKNSILMDGAQAPHFNYVGDSILGEKAHLGAGVICSNLRSDGKPAEVRLGAISITTGLRKLGAILGDNAEIGCGTVLCPGTVIGRSTTVYPLTLARGVYPSDSIVKSNGTVIPKLFD